MSISDRSSTDGLVLIDEVADWLVGQALGDEELEKIYEGLCIRLHAAGVPIARGSVGFTTLHPLFRAMTMIWTIKEGVEVIGHHHEGNPADWEASPYKFLLENGLTHLRRRLTGNDALLDFPILKEFTDRGATDYLAFTVDYGSGRDYSNSGGLTDTDGIIGSWYTERPSGFNDTDIRALNRIQRRLALACKMQKNVQVIRNVLNTYLGRGAGSHVLQGQIKRGDMESIHSVIWYSDMRDSTMLAEQLPGEEFLEVLNQYFECTAGAVMDHSGEVLRFIGDAVLAIFPIDKNCSAREAADRALAAANEARTRLDDINKQREPKSPINFGLGLHVGDVLFGNIGVPERLEFSVIGPAANEVARLESLTKTLDRDLLVSSEFAKHCKPSWESLGEHPLKGVGQPREVFGLKPAA